jgi:acetate kinase
MSRVLALNVGSSSLKYAVFDGDLEVLRGNVDRIGAGGAKDHSAAVLTVFEEIQRKGLEPIAAIGHRIVHGGPDHSAPERVTSELVIALQKATPFAPLHLPAELSAIDAVKKHFGDAPQVVCFDTAFHQTMPEVARRFAIPRALHDSGIKRYGFHGLSYEHVVASLGDDLKRRVVIAHLGNGASMAAVRDGKCIDTTMGFTPTGGLVMGTRSGDLDPGLMVYLLDHSGYDAKMLSLMVNHEAGLLALSETTSDMQELLRKAAEDPRAALAVDVFCYQAAKFVGALTASLCGIDQLVFTGGIGENASPIRARICRSLAHLGIELDDARNHANESVIARSSRCDVRIVVTNEERVIAEHTRRLLADCSVDVE